MPISGFGLGFSNELANYMQQERARARQQEDQQLDYHMELIKSLAQRPDINERPEIMGQAIHDMLELANAKGGKGKQSKGMAGFTGSHDLPVSQFLSGLVSGARPTVGPTMEPDPDGSATPGISGLQQMPSVPPPTTPVGQPTTEAPTGGTAILNSPIAMPPPQVQGPSEAKGMIGAGRGIIADKALNPPTPMPTQMKMKPVASEKQPYFISPEERAAQAGDIKRTEAAKTRTQEVGERMVEGNRMGLQGAELQDYALTGRIPTSRPTADIQNYEYAKAQGMVPGQQPPVGGAVTEPLPGAIPPPPAPVSLRDYQQQKANDKKPVVKPAAAPTATSAVKNYEYAKSQGFAGTFEQWQKEQANNKIVQPKVTGRGGITPAQTNSRVDRRAAQFDGEPIVKRYNVVNDAVQFIKSLNVNTTNPADDQGLIYAFAKAMDPDSVVREGEYATVQKYAQTWFDSFRFNAQRVLNNTEFLTPQARQNMKETIRQRAKPVQQQYDNLYKEYSRMLDEISPGGSSMLPRYQGAFTPDVAPKKGLNDFRKGAVPPPPSR